MAYTKTTANSFGLLDEDTLSSFLSFDTGDNNILICLESVLSIQGRAPRFIHTFRTLLSSYQLWLLDLSSLLLFGVWQRSILGLDLLIITSPLFVIKHHAVLHYFFIDNTQLHQSCRLYRQLSSFQPTFPLALYAFCLIQGFLKKAVQMPRSCVAAHFVVLQQVSVMEFYFIFSFHINFQNVLPERYF